MSRRCPAYATLERLGADEELLAIVGSMNDTLTDKKFFDAGRIQQDGNSVPPTTIGATMAMPPRKHRLSTEHQALEMLAGNPYGLTEDLLVLAHGFNSGT
jgi:hypothetical protein